MEAAHKVQWETPDSMEVGPRIIRDLIIDQEGAVGVPKTITMVIAAMAVQEGIGVSRDRNRIVCGREVSNGDRVSMR